MTTRKRHCSACGHPARRGDRLRFYRIQRRYLPAGGFRLEVLRVHRSHDMRGRS